MGATTSDAVWPVTFISIEPLTDRSHMDLLFFVTTFYQGDFNLVNGVFQKVKFAVKKLTGFQEKYPSNCPALLSRKGIQ